jgi:DNA-directed RNA polymerase subunit RPC12/RpoP
MSFATISQSSKGSDFKKVEYIDLPAGNTTIRILQPKTLDYFVHYINGAYIKCLEDECPICLSNRKLIAENPETFRDIKGWSSRSERHSVNVLDKTLVKICSKCKKEVKKVGANFPTTCPACGTVIVSEEIKPLNKVKILARGKTLFENFNGIENSVLDEAGNPIPLTAYDFTLFVTGTGRETNITVIPMTDKRDVVDVPEDILFDLSKTVIALTSDEMMEVQRGVSLKDIFATRKVQEPKEATAEAVATAEGLVKDLMGNI